MLQAQVNYWNLVEQQRHNIASEEVARDTLAETIRHQYQTESLEQQRLDEVRRHDVASEHLSSVANLASLRQASAALSQAATSQFRAETDKMLGTGQMVQTALYKSVDAAQNYLDVQTRKKDADTRRYEFWRRTVDMVGNWMLSVGE